MEIIGGEDLATGAKKEQQLSGGVGGTQSLWGVIEARRTKLLKDEGDIKPSQIRTDVTIVP